MGFSHVDGGAAGIFNKLNGLRLNTRQKQGFALLEIAVTMAILVPIIFGVIGLVDYVYITGKIKRVAVNTLPEINVPVLKVSQSSVGDYFSRINADNLRAAFDTYALTFRNRLASTLGLNPTQQSAFYRAEIGFVGYLIDVRTGAFQSLSGSSIATWSGSVNPPSNWSRNRAIYAKCFGGFITSHIDICPAHVCPSQNCSVGVGYARPNQGISPLYDMFFRLGQNQASDSEFKVLAISNPMRGTYQQGYYGESIELYYPAYTREEQLMDGLNYTTLNFLRHTAVFGVHITVDFRYRFTGKLMQAMGLDPVFKMNHLAVPRSLF
jgi:hypothetical protein